MLDLAVALDKVEFVRYFLEIGADINTSNNDQPPIHHAKSMEMMKLLLDYGANVDYIPEKTVTLLFTKVNQGKTDQALLLLDHGADMYPIESVVSYCTLFLLTSSDFCFFFSCVK